MLLLPLIYVSEILQLIEIIVILVAVFFCKPHGMMEWRNVGLRLVELTPRKAYASERILGMKTEYAILFK